MKAKQCMVALAAIAVGVLASCGGSGTTSSGISKKSLFGDIPELYEEKMLETVKGLVKAQESDDMQEAVAALEKLGTVFDEIRAEAKPLIDKLVGQKVAYALSDSLPYQVVSDIEVKDVDLPELALMAGGEKPTRLDVAFDVVMTQDVPALRLLYFVMDDDTPIGYGCTSGLGKHVAGDTVHVSTTINAPDVPAQYVKGCNLVKFVTEQAYRAEQPGMDEQAKKWKKELNEKHGI